MCLSPRTAICICRHKERLTGLTTRYTPKSLHSWALALGRAQLTLQRQHESQKQTPRAAGRGKDEKAAADQIMQRAASQCSPFTHATLHRPMPVRAMHKTATPALPSLVPRTLTHLNDALASRVLPEANLTPRARHPRPPFCPRTRLQRRHRRTAPEQQEGMGFGRRRYP